MLIILTLIQSIVVWYWGGLEKVWSVQEVPCVTRETLETETEDRKRLTTAGCMLVRGPFCVALSSCACLM